MDRKLQVFVSSTYLDLKAERQAAVEAILQAGHIPAGMELFTAGDKSQWETIQRWIAESDVLLLILGERYGSIEPTSRKSYIQLEYEHALDIGKPVFALVLDKPWIDRKYEELKREATDDFRTEHKHFKDIVLGRMSAIVDDLKDIKLEINRSLANFSTDPSLIGWVRGDEVAANRTVIKELTTTIDGLRQRSDRIVQTADAISSEIDMLLSELEKVTVDAVVLVRSSEGVDAYQRFVGNGLSLAWALRDEIDGLSEIGAPSLTRAFFRQILPMFQIWGLATVQRYIINLTPKGVLLVNKLKKMDFPPEKRGRFSSE